MTLKNKLERKALDRFIDVLEACAGIIIKLSDWARASLRKNAVNSLPEIDLSGLKDK